MFGIPFTNIKGAYENKINLIYGNLNSVLDIKKNKFENWINERISDTQLIAENRITRDFVSKLRTISSDHSKVLKNKPLKTFDTVTLRSLISDELKTMTETHAFYEHIHIIDAETSLIVASDDEAKIDKKISHLTEFLPDNSQASDLSVNFIYGKEEGHIQMSVVCAVNEGNPGKNRFFVYSHINTSTFLTPFLATGMGISESEEIVLVNDKMLNLTPLKFQSADKGDLELFNREIVTAPAYLAKSGKDSVVEVKDYRNITVLAAYRHIPISAEAGLGIVLKIDKEDIFSKIRERIILGFGTSFIFLLILLTSSMLILRKVTIPISQLSQASMKAESGDYSARVTVASNDEIGVLSERFNAMLSKIENSQNELECEVEKRTSELSETNRKLLDEIEKHHTTLRNLNENQAHLQAIMDYSPSVIFLKDLEGRYILVNKRFMELDRIAGRKKEDIIGTTAFDYTSGNAALEIEKAEKKVCNEGITLKSEKKMPGRIPEQWFCSTKFPLRDSSGQIYGTCTFVDEITESKQFENLIKERESQLRAIIDNSPTLIFIKDIEGKYIMINSEYEKSFNISQSEIIGKSDFDIFSEETARAIYENDRKVIKSGKAFKKEETVEQDDGTHIYLSVKFPLFDSEGKAYAICGISTDITDEKSKETELFILGTAIAQCEDAIVITDKDANIEYLNPAFERITGYSADEAIGQNPRILQSGEHNGEFYESMWNTLLSGKTWSGEFINQRKDKKIYYEEATISPVFDASGKIVNYVAVKKDVTEYKSREEQFMQAQKMESVGRLAGGVAHDFNNILVGILGYSELIAGMAKDIQIRKYAEEIQNAGERAASLTRQLLAFSRKQVIEPKVINLNQLIENLRNMLSRIIGEDIEIVLKLKESGLGAIKADPDQIAQVLLNLSVNARDAIKKGGKITIRTSNTEFENKYLREDAEHISGKYVVISISDTGKGMDAATQKMIFEPFFTTKKIGEGTGLGLSTVYGIVKQSNGYITVHSKPGKGTAFKIYLPRADTKDLSAIEKTSAEDVSVFGHERILIVEDEETVRDLACEIVSSKGYNAISATGPVEALQMAGNGIGTIDLLLTDLIMPEMDGIELADKLKGIIPSIKVLVMSGYSDKEIQRNGGIKKNIPYIQKPFSPFKLLEKIRRVLDESPAH